ncbi:MAG: isoprenyl transferase [Muribaculaceae bacterium]|nr:isoprenyl transferase [Muribaculaceae bacterium]
MLSLLNQIDPCRIPRHVAVIMDGNGRWAKAQGMARSEGHVKGVSTVRTITEAASQAGVGYLTLYTFSTENWNRPQDEVDTLMHLIVTAIERETPDLIKNNIRLTAIGDLGRMPAEALDRLRRCMDDTSICTGMTLVLALSYSSRWEITEACRALARKIKVGEADIADITPDAVSASLTTAGIPDPDLLIRTGGDVRISNFLLWQIAYAELYFTDTFWPDFSAEEFYKALLQYQRRERRFGMTSEQLNTK